MFLGPAGVRPWNGLVNSIALLTLVASVASLDGLAQQSAKAAVEDHSTSPSDPAAVDGAAAAVLESIATSDALERGTHNAKVTIVFFDDFQCPYSAHMYRMLFGEVLKQYGDRVRIVLQDAPNRHIHPWAIHAAVNARCLAAKNEAGFWDFADYVHANQQRVIGENRTLEEQLSYLDRLALETATRHNLAVPSVQECIREQPEELIKHSFENAVHLGIRFIPTVFINRTQFTGAATLPDLQEAINRALKEADQPADSSAAEASSASQRQANRESSGSGGPGAHRGP